MKLHPIVLLAITTFSLIGGQAFAVSDCVTSNPLPFIRCVARFDRPVINDLRNGPEAGLIVFEGNTNEFTLPSTDKIDTLIFVGSDKTYRLDEKHSGNVYERVTHPLTSVNSDLSSTFTENIIWISQEMTRDSEWILNETIPEFKSTTVTIGAAYEVLQDKYGLSHTPKPVDEKSRAAFFDRVVVNASSQLVTVREVLRKILRENVKANYEAGLYQDTVAAFQIMFNKEPDGTNRITIVYLTTSKY